uniref:Uncharacterized protein n=2 Tax=Clonostachys TaxID=110564 RepID=A0A8H7N0G4_BIOOC
MQFSVLATAALLLSSGASATHRVDYRSPQYQGPQPFPWRATHVLRAGFGQVVIPSIITQLPKPESLER